jgi:uncharacterized spore protein YtfJ
MDAPTHPARARGPSDLLETISTRLAQMASQKTVFGDPITCRDTTIVPVATVRLGFGGGGGHRADEQEGGGGGGGGVAIPVGFIEIGQRGARYRRIRPPMGAGSRLLLMVLGALSIRLVLRLRPTG